MVLSKLTKLSKNSFLLQTVLPLDGAIAKNIRSSNQPVHYGDLSSSPMLQASK